jgi:hypothetical protein
MNIFINHLLDSNNANDIAILLKIAILSTHHYNFLYKKIMYHKAYIIGFL